MKNFFAALAAIAILYAPTAMATPILSADGSKLSGVDVGGVLYDIFFGDGILSEQHPAAQVNSPNWTSLALAVAEASARALNEIPGLIDNADINGCEDHAGIPGFVGADVCIMVIPTHITSRGHYAASHVLTLYPDYERGPAFFGPNPLPVTLLASTDTSVPFPTGLGPMLTIATFEPSEIPAPSSLVLLALGLLGIYPAARRNTR